MLGIAGLGIAFHAKPKVVANAKQSINTIGLDGVLYSMPVSDVLTAILAAVLIVRTYRALK